MQKLLQFLKSYGHLKWTTTTIIICAIPVGLLFIMLNLIIFIFDEHAGAIVSNDKTCAKIGGMMLKDGGSVVDGAIATMLCEGVILPNRAGIGGGFTAITYINGVIETITATPTVPAKYPVGFISGDRDKIDGSQAGGVPGELMGYWELHRKYGLLPWRSLFEPTIALCEEGVPITEWFELDLQRSSLYLYRSKTMRQLYQKLFNQSDGGRFKFLPLAKTLRRIATDGPYAFYNGDVGKTFIEDIQLDKAYMTEDDLRDYNVSWGYKPVIFSLPNRRRGYISGLPTLGPVVAMVINIIKGVQNKDSPVFWHKTIEAMKHAYGLSYGLSDINQEPDPDVIKKVMNTFKKMTSMDFAYEKRALIKDDSIAENYTYYGVEFQPTMLAGSSNIGVISPNGNALVMTSSLMWDFGTFAWSPRTGIILNNQIRSFASYNVPGLKRFQGTYVRPGKRAITPSSPTIVLDRQTASIYFVVGASGSDLIPSQVISVLILYCLMHRNAFKATNSGFFHPIPTSNKVHISHAIAGEEDFGEDVLSYLKKVGHNISEFNKDNPYAVRTCIGHAHIKPDVQFTFHELGGTAVVEPAHGFNTFLIIVIISLSIAIISVMIYEISTFNPSEIDKGMDMEIPEEN